MKNTVILIILFSSLSVLYLLYNGKHTTQLSQSISTNPNSNENTQSYMAPGEQNYEIEIPLEATIEIGTSSTQVVVGENTIVIIRNGTNFTNLDNYLADLDMQNLKDVRSKEPFIIDGYNFVSRDLGSAKQYYGYVEGWIYNFSTSSPELYDDLDQIAQSFRYLGD